MEQNVSQPVVLIIDAEPMIRQMLARMLNDSGQKLEVLLAGDLDTARKMFDASLDRLAVIATAGKLQKSAVDLTEVTSSGICALVQEMRKKFNGPIIAMSGSEVFMSALLQAGCTMRCDDKAQVPGRILALLKA